MAVLTLTETLPNFRLSAAVSGHQITANIQVGNFSLSSHTGLIQRLTLAETLANFSLRSNVVNGALRLSETFSNFSLSGCIKHIQTVSNITLISGGPAVHVTLYEDSIWQPPYQIVWTTDAVLQPVSIESDTNGFLFEAPVGMDATEATAGAYAINTINGGVGRIGVNVIIEPMEFSSP
jgi:hypothetical protein